MTSTPTPTVTVSEGIHRMNHLPPRLQIADASTSSKPDNYRISPVTPNSATSESVWEDWSGLGRGSHVDFEPNEILPLEQGRFLGRGSMGEVYETVIRGVAFAWKRRFCRRKIGENERREIEILKKLSHIHIIEMVGTYTHGHFLGLLLHPVATCDLHTLFEDFEACSLHPEQQEKDFRLGIKTADVPTYLLSKIGCMVAAVEYLHDHKIRHKDLKPSNILLSPDRLLLADFGSATDFSLLSVSATDNGERGTPKYFAPEVAAFKPAGRAADIFSLGCILLEMFILCDSSTLEALRALRPDQDKSFQANLDKMQEWCSLLAHHQSGRGAHIVSQIRQMLLREPMLRPTATVLRKYFAFIDTLGNIAEGTSIFSNCCRISFISKEEHQSNVARLTQQFVKITQRTQVEHEDSIKSLSQQYNSDSEEFHFELGVADSRLHQAHAEIAGLEAELGRKVWSGPSSGMEPSFPRPGRSTSRMEMETGVVFEAEIEEHPDERSTRNPRHVLETEKRQHSPSTYRTRNLTPKYEHSTRSPRRVPEVETRQEKNTRAKGQPSVSFHEVISKVPLGAAYLKYRKPRDTRKRTTD